MAGGEAAETGTAACVVAAMPAPLAGYPDLLTVADIAEVLHVSERNVYRLVDRGELPFHVRVGRRIYFPKRLVIEALRLGEG
jgi:excisionase family DNA binding protein